MVYLQVETSMTTPRNLTFGLFTRKILTPKRLTKMLRAFHKWEWTICEGCIVEKEVAKIVEKRRDTEMLFQGFNCQTNNEK